MSWDVLVFNFDGPVPPDETLKQKGYQPPPLGTAHLVREKISRSVPGIDWSNPGWGILRMGSLLIEFGLQEDGIVDCLGIHVYGRGNPMPVIQHICSDNGWSAFDTSSGDWLDYENPSDAGWQSFQSFRDNLIEEHKRRGDC